MVYLWTGVPTDTEVLNITNTGDQLYQTTNGGPGRPTGLTYDTDC